MTAAEERACELLERRAVTSIAQAENEIKNARAVIACIHTWPNQRIKAQEDIEAYTVVIQMLKRSI